MFIVFKKTIRIVHGLKGSVVNDVFQIFMCNLFDGSHEFQMNLSELVADRLSSVLSPASFYVLVF